MFKFKKSMAGVAKQENFECECCGSANNSCCGPVGNSNSENGQQLSGCVPCSTSTDNSCCSDSSEKPKASTESNCCTSRKNSYCG